MLSAWVSNAHPKIENWVKICHEKGFSKTRKLNKAIYNHNILLTPTLN